LTGYVTDSPYADTWFRELSPAWLNYVVALNGARPQPLDGPFRYLELGCGFGTSCVLNAAAFPRGWFDACDFNPAHVQAGRSYAARLELGNIGFHETPFQELLATDLEPYQFIVMHGVHSWVDAATRQVLRELVDRLLVPGGLLYVSYNALPGWSAELSLRRLLVELAAGEAGTAAQRAAIAAARIASLRRAGLRYFTANPGAASAADAYARGDGEYLAHEFMNDAWEPSFSVDVADEFGAIGLEFAGSATLPNNHLALVVDTATASAVAEVPTLRQQHLVTDFAVNQRFRRDVFVRGAGSSPRRDYFDQAVIGCATDVDDIRSTVQVPRGEIHFQEPFVRDVRALFARGSWPFAHAVAELHAAGVSTRAGRDQDRAAVARNLVFMVASGVLAPFAEAAGAAAAPPMRLASATVERALAGKAVRSRRLIPSAVHGNAIAIDEGTATSLAKWSRGEQVPEAFVLRRLPTLARLGIVA
jgi:SAM-dependent methyltransferase